MRFCWKLETVKHKKINEILRSHHEKTPRKRRRSRSREEEENYPKPFKSPRCLKEDSQKTASNTDQIWEKADHTSAKADLGSTKAGKSLLNAGSGKADPSSENNYLSSVKADPSYAKADASYINVRKFSTKSTTARKSTRTPARKQNPAKQSPKVSNITLQKTSNLISYLENLQETNPKENEKSLLPKMPKNSATNSPSKQRNEPTQLKITSIFYRQPQKSRPKGPKASSGNISTTSNLELQVSTTLTKKPSVQKAPTCNITNSSESSTTNPT